MEELKNDVVTKEAEGSERYDTEITIKDPIPVSYLDDAAESEKSGSGLIGGIVVGAVATAAGMFLWTRHKKKKARKEEAEQASHAEPVEDTTVVDGEYKEVESEEPKGDKQQEDNSKKQESEKKK